MVELFDKKLIDGIEQILNDYQGDLQIRAHLNLGEEFHLFSKSDGSGYYCLGRDGVHSYSASGADNGLVSVREVATDYYYMRASPHFGQLRRSPSVTGVKLRLLLDLEERAEEFREFDH